MLLDSLLDNSIFLLMIMKLLMFSSLQVEDVDSVIVNAPLAQACHCSGRVNSQGRHDD